LGTLLHSEANDRHLDEGGLGLGVRG